MGNATADATVRKGSRAWRVTKAFVRLLDRIARERTTPVRTGFAVGLGVLIGTSPFFGLHLGICVVVATVFRLNRVITYLAANISMPWIAPFLILGSIQLGSLIVDGHVVPLTLAGLSDLDPWRFSQAWVLGALVLGTLLGIPAGVAAYFFTRAYRRRHPIPEEPAVQAYNQAAAEVALAYRDLGRFTHGYVRGKLRSDPVFRQLAERAPLASPAVDFGCGRGQTLVLFALLQPNLEGIGIDWDAPKIELARRAAKAWPRLRWEVGDIRTCAVPEAATIFMLDVLHYNPRPVQDEMLRRAARALVPGGVLYVRELDANGSWRARVNAWQERIGCAMRLNRGATLCFRPVRELVAVLESEGLTATITPSWADLPLANVLVEARRQTSTTASRAG